MNPKRIIHEIEGNYFGTEIDEKWWKRYSKNKVLARGNGFFWCDQHSIHFLRYLTKEPIVILLANVIEFKTGKWHAERWGGGNKLLKVIWKQDRQRLSSGFALSSKPYEVVALMLKLEKQVKSIKPKVN